MNDICRNDSNTEFWGTDRCNIIFVFLAIISIPILMRFKQCKNMSLFWWDWCGIVYVTSILLALYVYQSLRSEGFGSTSPGTLITVKN